MKMDEWEKLPTIEGDKKMRVPGGWIYKIYCESKLGACGYRILFIREESFDEAAV